MHQYLIISVVCIMLSLCRNDVFAFSRFRGAAINNRMCSSFAAGTRVKFQGNNFGIILEKRNHGWWRIQCAKSNEVISLRKKDFIVDGSSSDAEVQKIISNPVLVDKEILPQIELPTIKPPASHVATKQWIIFSDLHVKAQSIDTCEEVLEKVHEAAVSRGAGIIFLGDFWHVRGAVSVDLLNRVLLALSKWVQPVIMIPGNKISLMQM